VEAGGERIIGKCWEKNILPGKRDMLSILKCTNGVNMREGV